MERELELRARDKKGTIYVFDNSLAGYSLNDIKKRMSDSEMTIIEYHERNRDFDENDCIVFEQTVDIISGHTVEIIKDYDALEVTVIIDDETKGESHLW